MIHNLKQRFVLRKLVERSYTGYEKEVQKYHPPWITDEGHPFVKKTLRALKKIGQNPEIKYWKFGTDGSMTSALMGISYNWVFRNGRTLCPYTQRNG